MDTFDEMVDDILSGEGLIAEFDDGVMISAYDLDKIGITIEEVGHTIDIVLSDEVLEYLHLFLEVQHAAKAHIENVNWDELLSGNA